MIAESAWGRGAGIRIQVGPERARLGKVVLLHLTCLCYFGGAGIISLAAITGLGHGIVAGTIAVGAGLAGWSLTGFKPELADRWLPKPQIVGLALVTIGLLAALLTQSAIGGATALAVLISGWFVSGIGMGIAYPRFSASAMDELPSDRVLPVATAVAFSETSATAIAGFIGGGTYSVGRSLELSPPSALSWAFSLLTVFGVASIVLYRRLGAGDPARSFAPHHGRIPQVRNRRRLPTGSDCQYTMNGFGRTAVQRLCARELHI